jgi:phosphate transport system protein
VANDLRFVFSVVKINGYLEQMGDLINYISRKTLKFDEPISPELMQELRLMEMLENTRQIIAGAVSAFFMEDTERTRAIFPMDDVVDEIHKASFEIIARHIEAKPSRVRTLMQLLINIKSIEKIADLAVNIAEEAVFNTEAVVVKHSELKNAHRHTAQEPAP